MKSKTHCADQPSTMLCLAIEKSDIALLTMALDQEADPNAEIRMDSHAIDGHSSPAMNPLNQVLSEVRPEHKPAFIRTLIEHGANPNLPNAQGGTAFLRALMRGDVRSATAMMDCAQIDLLHRDDQGWVPSMAAVCEMPAEFLQRMQDLFESTHWIKRPELSRNHLWICRDSGGQNAMIIAHDKPIALHWLLSNPNLGMESHLEDTCLFGQTVLWRAACVNQAESVRILLGAGAKTSASMMDHLLKNKKFHGQIFPKGIVQRTLDIMGAAHASQEAVKAIDGVINANRIHRELAP